MRWFSGGREFDYLIISSYSEQLRKRADFFCDWEENISAYIPVFLFFHFIFWWWIWFVSGRWISGGGSSTIWLFHPIMNSVVLEGRTWLPWTQVIIFFPSLLQAWCGPHSNSYEMFSVKGWPNHSRPTSCAIMPAPDGKLQSSWSSQSPTNHIKTHLKPCNTFVKVLSSSQPFSPLLLPVITDIFIVLAMLYSLHCMSWGRTIA